MSSPNINGRDMTRETIIGAILGAVIQVVLTIILTSTIQPDVLIAIIIVLPFTVVAFLGFRFFYQRWRKQESPSFAPIPQPETSIQQTTENIPAIDNNLFRVIEEMGIISATSILTKSRYEPLECMRQTRRKLYFTGILASKWVIEPHVRMEFRNFLQRIQAQGGSVHFLLLNPNSKAYKQLKSQRGGISAESLKHLKVLRNEFSSCFQVRLYNQSPCFRLVFIDDKILALSRYKIDKEGYFKSRFGWEAPHLVIQAEAPWSLYEAFEIYFQQVWELSQEL